MRWGRRTCYPRYQSSCKILIRQVIHILPMAYWLHACMRREVGLKLFPPRKSILMPWAWLHKVCQVLYLHCSSSSAPRTKAMWWVELLIHLSMRQVARLVWWGKRRKAATHCKSNRAAFYHHLSPALPSAQRGVARSLSSRRASYKCMA